MSTSTTIINGSLIYMLAVCTLLFFINIFFLVYFLIRYRHARNPVPIEIKGSTFLEISWVVFPTIIVITFFIYGLTGFQFFRSIPHDSLRIKVHARQFSWLFEYPNGRINPDLVVPVNRNIRCDLVTEDVVHGFYIPAYRIQQDIVPGLKTQVWFNAVSEGSVDILCAQYCGLHHADMRARLVAVSKDKYDEWYAGTNISYPGKPEEAAGIPSGLTLINERGCLSCHSIDGTPRVGPTLKDLYGSRVNVISTNGIRTTVIADDKFLIDAIISPGVPYLASGYPNIMPSGRPILSDREIGEIIDYLKEIKK